MRFLFAYFGLGVAVLIVLWVLYGKTGVDRKGLRWLLVGDLGFVLVPLLWPFFAFLSLLWWLGDYWHLKSKQRDVRERAMALKNANEYSHLTMEELLAKQKKIMDEAQNPK